MAYVEYCWCGHTWNEHDQDDTHIPCLACYCKAYHPKPGA